MSNSSQPKVSYWRLLWPGIYLRRILRSNEFYQALQAHIKEHSLGELLLLARWLFRYTRHRFACALGVALLVVLLAFLSFLIGSGIWPEWLPSPTWLQNTIVQAVLG